MFSIERATRSIRESWWGIIVAYIISFIIVYGALWYFLEPPAILDQMDYSRFANRPTFYWTLTLLLSSHLTLILELIFRRTRWAPRNIDPKELNRFHQEVRPLLTHMKHMPRVQLSSAEAQRLSSILQGVNLQEKVVILATTNIQDLVKRAVRVMTKLHFGVSELPPYMCLDSIPFDEDEKISCKICMGNDVGITDSGHCPRCKLCCATWLGIREQAAEKK